MCQSSRLKPKQVERLFDMIKDNVTVDSGHFERFYSIAAKNRLAQGVAA